MKGFWFWAFWGMCPCNTHIPPHKLHFLDLFFQHYQVLMVVFREFWPFFLTEYTTCKTQEWCSKEVHNDEGAVVQKAAYLKTPNSQAQCGKGYHRIPKAFFKVSKVFWEERWIKKVMWDLGKSVLKSLFSNVHTTSACNKERLLWVQENAGVQQEELTLLRGH